MPSTLVDAGIIVAALNRNDRFHAAALELIGNYEGRLLTTWPVIAEACALVYAAWRTGVREVWTIDEDFRVYRLPDKSRFKVVPGRG